MPIYQGKDYFRYGKTGKKYHFDLKSKESIVKAYQKAVKQMRAIKANEKKNLT